jgi:acetolactate synthase I/II/III large subunit
MEVDAMETKFGLIRLSSDVSQRPPIDYVKYAEAFGAKGLMIKSPEEIVPVMKKAFETQGAVIIGVHVDYRDNHKLFEAVSENSFP